MVNIPQYTQRFIAEPAKRTQFNVKEPSTFYDTKHLERQGKIMTDLSKDAAKAFIQMKKERDEGIVNEFMNTFTLDRNLKLSELREKYNGKNAHDIIKSYNEWQEQYLIDHRGINREEDDNSLYLENEEQVAAAKIQMRKDLGRLINSLSYYSATQLGEYTDAQYKARINQLMFNGAKERNLENLRSIGGDIAAISAQRYSDKVVADVSTRELTAKMYADNIANTMTEDPFLALQALSTPDFKNQFDQKTYKELNASAIKALVDRLGNDYAENAVGGYSEDVALSDEQIQMIMPALKDAGMTRETLQDAILQKQSEVEPYLRRNYDAMKKRTNNRLLYEIDNIQKRQAVGALTDEEASDRMSELLNAQSNRAYGGDVIPSVVLEVEARDLRYRNGLEKYQEASRKIEGYRNQIRTLDEIGRNPPALFFDKEQNDLLIRNAREQIDTLEADPDYQYMRQVSQQMNAEAPIVSDIIRQINRGNYVDIGSFPNFPYLTAPTQRKIIDAINADTEYNVLANNLKDKNFDLNESLNRNFKEVFGIKPSSSPVLYGTYRDIFKNTILEYMGREANTLPKEEDIYNIGWQARNKMGSLYPEQLAVLNVSSKIKPSGFISTEDLISQYKKALDDEDALDGVDDSVLDMLADDLAKNNIDLALIHIQR